MESLHPFSVCRPSAKLKPDQLLLLGGCKECTQIFFLNPWEWLARKSSHQLEWTEGKGERYCIYNVPNAVQECLHFIISLKQLDRWSRRIHFTHEECVGFSTFIGHLFPNPHMTCPLYSVVNSCCLVNSRAMKWDCTCRVAQAELNIDSACFRAKSLKSKEGNHSLKMHYQIKNGKQLNRGTANTLWSLEGCVRPQAEGKFEKRLGGIRILDLQNPVGSDIEKWLEKEHSRREQQEHFIVHSIAMVEQRTLTVLVLLLSCLGQLVEWLFQLGTKCLKYFDYSRSFPANWNTLSSPHRSTSQAER